MTTSTEASIGELLWLGYCRDQPVHFPYQYLRAMRLGGELDRSALERALCEFIGRHEMMRTTYTFDPIRKVVAPPPATFELRLVEIEVADPAAPLAGMWAHAMKEHKPLFDLVKGPLVRFTLYRLGPTDHVLLIAMHASVSDHTTMHLVLASELEQLYGAFTSGATTSPLRPLPSTYSEFSAAHQKSIPELVPYWENKLKGLPRVELPYDREPPPRTIFASHPAGPAEFMPVPIAQATITELARSADASPTAVLLAVLALTLHKQSGQRDLAIVTTLTRRGPETNHLAGPLANAVVFRVDVSGDPSFRSLVQRTRVVVDEAVAHGDMPIVRSPADEMQQVPRLMPDLELSRLHFIGGNDWDGLRPLQIPGLTCELHFNPPSWSDVVPFHQMWFMIGAGKVMFLNVLYASDLFDAATIKRQLADCAALLAAAVAEPDRTVSQLTGRTA